MERGRRIAVVVVGLVVMVLAAVVVVRAAGGGDGTQLASEDDSGSVDGLSGAAIELPAPDLQPGDPAPLDELIAPAVPTVPGAAPPPPLLPPEEPPAPDTKVITIPLPDFGATAPGRVVGGTPSAPAFSERGVWVVKTNGTSPILVARDATAGVAASGTWIAFVEGDAVKAVRRTDLRTKVPLASGVSGTAAQGLPIAGGRRGVAYLQGGKAHLADPADRSVRSVEAPDATAVAAEEDGDGRLLWGSDAAGLRIDPTESLPSAQVDRGVLTMGHGFLAHLRKDGTVAVRSGAGGDWATMSWGAVDRLQTGPAGLVAASAGRVHLRTRAGQDTVLLDRASTPVLTGDRIFYVSASQTIATAALSGTDVRNVAGAGSGRSITNLDLLDESTLVVTVS